MDVLGPLLEAPGKVRFVIVAVDYFIKWIEAKPLAKTTGKEVKKFVWDNIVCRYGLPKIIVTDNRTNFIHDPFKSWCKKLNITQINTAVTHPQANGLVERANRSLMEGIKTRLGRERKGWVDELPNILWAYRTPLKTNNGETSYSLMFGSEAVILAEIDMPTHRMMTIKEGNGNEEEIRLNLDLLTERREAVAIREARYKMKMEQYYNKRVSPMSFKVGEYIYLKNKACRVENLEKLGPK
ncbi:reverse transcriptase domain-containing protein [Tanacetum coccineum]